MYRVLGYSLFVTGSVSAYWIATVRSNIPIKEMWFVLAICVAVAGCYFLTKFKIRGVNHSHEGSLQDQTNIQDLKKNGECVKITLDNAQLKNRSYEQEIISDSLPTRIQMIDGLYDPERNYNTRRVQQSYLVYERMYPDGPYKFISQPFFGDPVNLRSFMENSGFVNLYIDRQNPSNYYYDVKFG